MCGFTDVRLDEDGYYCTICGTRLPVNSEDTSREAFREFVEWASGSKMLKKLDEQCGV